jgi:hypothetical protein
MLTAVNMKETALAALGTPHWPPIMNVRVARATREGGPYCPVKPLPVRVSATRHGGIGTNGTGPDMSVRAVRPPGPEEGDHDGGAGQLAMGGFGVPPKAAEAAKDRRRKARALLLTSVSFSKAGWLRS